MTKQRIRLISHWEWGALFRIRALKSLGVFFMLTGCFCLTSCDSWLRSQFPKGISMD